MDGGSSGSAAALLGEILLDEPLGADVINEFLSIADEEGSHLGIGLNVVAVGEGVCSTVEFARD